MWRCCCCCGGGGGGGSTLGAHQSDKTREDDGNTLSILILGLNGSGKTEISCAMANEKRVDMSPTNGLRLFTRQLGHFVVTFTEVGGNSDIRKIWPHYYHKAFAIIYVVDLSTADDDRCINESYHLLSEIIPHRYVRGKPILVLANKTDLCDFPDILDFYEHFPLERLANSYQSHILLQCCGRGDYTELHSGLSWLQFHIETNYKRMRNRIAFDCLSKRKEEQDQKLKKTKTSTKSGGGGGSMRSKTISQLGKILWRPLSAPANGNTSSSKLRSKSACVRADQQNGSTTYHHHATTSTDEKSSKTATIGESGWRNHLKRNNRIHSETIIEASTNVPETS